VKDISGEPIYPSHFQLSIGGYGGMNYRVEWDGSSLHYYTADWHPADRLTATVEPSPSDWQQFWQAMDEVELWAWKERYFAPGVMDGTQWEVEIEWAGRCASSGGSNRYPGYEEEGVEDACETRRFERFTEAVSKLVGGRAFE
jgi:hypothetical protein